MGKNEYLSPPPKLVSTFNTIISFLQQTWIKIRNFKRKSCKFENYKLGQKCLSMLVDNITWFDNLTKEMQHPLKVVNSTK
jgi:hypothetical protein